MIRRSRPVLTLLAASTALAVTTALAGTTSAVGSTSSGGSEDHARPTKVLIVLFDQMRPEYADRFYMPNFRSLRSEGTNFNNAYLGYMGSETVISHNVLMSGQQPRHQGWVDEAYRDVNGVLDPTNPNQMYTTGELTYDQFGKLVQNAHYPKLADYLQIAQPGKKFMVVGQKSYAVESAAAKSAFDTSDSDIYVRMSGRNATTTAPCYATLGGSYRGPFGVNVPEYLAPTGANAACGRFYVNSDKANTYGTSTAFPGWIYPMDGNRFVPGYDPGHLGGDTWTADAAMAMMANEDWSGMFVTMGGIDKAGHVWGADQDVQSAPGSIDYQTHVQYQAENADLQLGYMLDKLRELGQLDDTLVVLTADHGATHGGQFYGRMSPGGSSTSDTNWYYGPDSKPTIYNNPSPALARLIATNNVQFSYQSTSIQTWLRDRSPAKRDEAVAAMQTLPGVMATYWRDGGRFVLADTNSMSKSESKWWNKTGQSIVDTMAAPDGPDVVGLLNDDISYGAYGDHGGASEEVQRVPMVFWSPSIAYANNTDSTFKSTDVMPTILKTLGIKLTSPVDGKARSLD